MRHPRGKDWSSRPSWRGRLIGVFIVVWVASITLGVAGLSRYAASPGTVASPPEAWPTGSMLDRATGSPTLVVFVHSRCPCSSATLAELQRVIAMTGSRTDTLLVFPRPADEPDAWVDGRLWAAAGRVRGVRRVIDPGGVEARRFGATTSGHCMLFDASGSLLFTGGITLARGHEGDNPGRVALVAAIRSAEAQPGAAVFGCALVLPRESRRVATP